MFNFIFNFINSMKTGNKKSENIVNVNGKEYHIQANSIVISNDKIFADGVEIVDNSSYKQIDIKIDINSTLSNLKIENGSVIVNGDINGNIKSGGNFKCN